MASPMIVASAPCVGPTTPGISGGVRRFIWNCRTGLACSSIPRPTCAPRRFVFTSPRSTPFSSRTATPITSSGSTKSGATTCCKAPMPCYGDRRTVADIRRRHSFTSSSQLPGGVGAFPESTCSRLPDRSVWAAPRSSLCRSPWRPIDSWIPIDRSRISPTPMEYTSHRWPLLQGVRLLVIDALRERPHPTHFTVAEALEVCGSSAPRPAYLTHMTHDLAHAATCARLPHGVELAYDGLR